MSNSTVGNHSETADIATGTFILLCTVAVLGVPANIVSFSYFYTLKVNARNSNGIFFKRVYTLITAVDCLICASAVTMIEHLYTQRVGVFYQEDYLFHIILAVTAALCTASIFLVAVLSVSRSLVLVCPTKQLPLLAVWSVPGAMTLLTTVLYIVASTVSVEWVVDAALLLVASIMGFPIIPIGISCIFSIVHLKRAKDRAIGTNASPDQHVEATLTVTIVTFLYVVLNFPVFLYGLYSILAHTMSREQDTLFETYYLQVIVLTLLPGINSALNPAIYFWRMTSFRRYALRQVQDKVVQNPCTSLEQDSRKVQDKAVENTCTSLEQGSRKVQEGNETAVAGRED